MTDIQKLKALAEAATPGRNFDRLPEAGGGLKYECTGDDGSLVLKVDHKNDEWGFVGDRGEQDEAFFLACTPAAVLELIAEIESLKSRLEMESAELAWSDSDGRAIQAERDQLKAESEAQRKDAERWRFFSVLANELQAFPHSWGQMTPEKMNFMCDQAMADAAMSKEDSHD